MGKTGEKYLKSIKIEVFVKKKKNHTVFIYFFKCYIKRIIP